MEQLRRETLLLANQSEQQMFGPDVVMAEHPRLLLGEHHDLPSSLGEPLKHLNGAYWRDNARLRDRPHA